MKKILFSIGILFLAAGVCFAAPNWLPRQFPVTTNGSEDQQITTTSTVITDMSIYYKGVTAGDILILRNGLAGAGTKFFTFIAPAANGTLPHVFKDNYTAGSGVYLDQTISGGYMGISITYN